MRVVLTGISLSVVLAAVSNSTKAVLLEGAAGTFGFGALCFLSLMRARPLLFYFIQAFFGGRHSDEGVSMERAYANYDEGRRYFRTVTVVWGAANIVEAAALAVVVQIVSTGTALAFNRILPWVVGVPLFIWSYRWGMRMRGEQAAHEAELATTE